MSLTFVLSTGAVNKVMNYVGPAGIDVNSLTCILVGAN